MKGFLKITAAFFLCFLFGEANASASDSTGNDIFEIERKTIMQRIEFEKVRIANDYPSADFRVSNLVDSIAGYINSQNFSKEKRNQYLLRLQVFLENINRYYSDSYLKNGTYLAVLSYYPVLIEWDRKDELLRNVKRYANFSVKAVRLIPSDTVAEDFLADYLNDHPDDIFRYAEEYDDRKFALRLLEKAVRLAPESAKRYYTSTNTVNTILKNSNDLYVKKTYEIYNRFGIKSRAYLLLDAILNNNMSIEAADSLGNNPNQMFSLLVQLSMKYEANVTYSIYRYMDIYCMDAMRKLNEDALNTNYQFENFKKYSPEEMFVLISYGYRQTTQRTLRTLFDILRKKSTGIPISSVMITGMDKEKLKELVIYCDQNQMLDELLALVDDEKKDYLLALTTIEEREDLFPPFKTFAKDNPKMGDEPEDRAMNEITKARPPKLVSADTMSGEVLIVRPEKIGEKEKTPEPVVAENKTAVVTETPTPPPAVATKEPDIVPIPVTEVIEPIKIELDDRTRSVISLEKNILQSLQSIPSFINLDYSEQVLRYGAEKEPDEMFKKIEQYRNKRYSLSLLEECAITAPVSVKRYLYNPNHPVNYILGYSQNAVVKKILEINPQLGYHSKPLLLLDDIVNGKTSVKDAIAISTDPGKLFSGIVKIISKPKYLGKYSIDHEMRDYSLRFIREINDKIATGSTQPFYSVEGFNAQELYFLMLYGRDEVFNSTFNGLFNRFMQKLPNGDGNSFLVSVSNNNFRDFLSLCSNYGVLEEFLSKFSPDTKQKLLVAYISNLEKSQDDLSSIVLVAEAISNLKDNQVLTTLQSTIKKEYERVKADSNQIGVSIYGVLSSIISGNARVESGWYKKVAQQFNVSPVSSLTSAQLFTDNICVEQMYFYNDDDGRSSFINFMNTYKNQPNWVVEDKSNYIRIYSATGKKVEILANKPEYEENGISAIDAYLLERHLQPTVIVHRGHSFHTESTLEKVPASAKLIFVGSCGGFYKISVALENAPDAHIIATKQIGTKSVNDVMIFALNEIIRDGKDIVWNDFWDRMGEKLGSNQYFRDYIPPHKNLESIFIKAYYKILGV
ncbi:MAG: hypothetical protein U0V74_10685 [Chitinophagales bacterium]